MQQRELLELLARADLSDDQSGASIFSLIPDAIKAIPKIGDAVEDGLNILGGFIGGYVL